MPKFMWFFLFLPEALDTHYCSYSSIVPCSAAQEPEPVQDQETQVGPHVTCTISAVLGARQLTLSTDQTVCKLGEKNVVLSIFAGQQNS